MARMRWLTAVGLCVCAVSLAQPTESVWPALRAPGTVVILRHSFCPWRLRSSGRQARRLLDPTQPRQKWPRASSADRRRVSAERDRGRRGIVEPALPLPGHGPPGLRPGAVLGCLARRAQRRGTSAAPAHRDQAKDRRASQWAAAGPGHPWQRGHRCNWSQRTDGRVRRPAAGGRWQPCDRRSALHRVKGPWRVPTAISGWGRLRPCRPRPS